MTKAATFEMYAYFSFLRTESLRPLLSTWRPSRCALPLLAMLFLGACSDEGARPIDSGPGQVDRAAGSCRTDEFQFVDEQCLMTTQDGAPVTCKNVGDYLCYKICTKDTDCTDKTKPYCSVQGLFKGSNAFCSGKMTICRAKKSNDC